MSIFHEYLSTIERSFSQSRSFKHLQHLIKTKQYPKRLLGIHGSFGRQVLAQLVKRVDQSFVLVVPSDQDAQILTVDFEALGIESITLPSPATGFYSPVSHSDGTGAIRVQSLVSLLNDPPKLVIVPLRSLLAPVPPIQWIKDRSLILKKGSPVEVESLKERLSSLGYDRVSFARTPGEYSLRGEVLDLVSSHGQGRRLIFAFDEVTAIKGFDPETQVSTESYSSLSIQPIDDVIWDQERIAGLKASLESIPELQKKSEGILEALSLKGSKDFYGEREYFGLSFEKPSYLNAYLPTDAVTLWYQWDRTLAGSETIHKEADGQYRKLRLEQALPAPSRVFKEVDWFRDLLSNQVLNPLIRDDLSNDPDKAVDFKVEEGRSFFGNIALFKEELDSLAQVGQKAFITTPNPAQVARLQQLFDGTAVQIFHSGLQSGFKSRELGLALFHEDEIFGRRKRIPRSVQKVKTSVIESFVELEEGDHVVHIQHGIGRFRGIHRVKTRDTERDYIKVEYAKEEFVFVPIEQVNLIQRYIGSSGNPPALDVIGGKSWERRKSKVKSHVEDIADELIQLYAARQNIQGYAHPSDSEWQIAFESAFPFEETEDQIACIEQVKKDMESPTPMDRLVCGDVGFGKTEIALRAAFKAVSAGKQVAILAPTTILAEQHYETLQDRVKDFPVNVALMSRLVSKAEQRKVIKSLKEGKVDVVVGTHRVLQKDMEYKDLGLLVIDEEQRFGVKDKERLKAMKKNVDCLTMTATPIPRTLHMSLLKIRDMSLLTTPPSVRRPIETHIQEFNDEVVARAIRREIERGGQVFYLHNKVKSLDQVQLYLQQLVPEILVDVAHGQMDAKELDDIMHRFIHGAFQVLVATTIIENGINIPNVNTIIIDRADMYGVSQLYQLRGRVGRSNKIAYAYLLYPEERALTELAMKRLQIISDHTELGAGFKIAMKDLEVRGAGNLLGAEQSGEILSVGFDLYVQLLSEAIRKRQVKEEELDDDQEVYLELQYTGFIPNNYIETAVEKMEIYKKISTISTQAQLESVSTELEDRFGPMPEEVLSLLSLAELRILAKQLHISSLRERKGFLELEFRKVAHIQPDRVLGLIQESQGRIKLDPKRANVLIVNTGHIGLKEKSEFIRDRLASLRG